MSYEYFLQCLDRQKEIWIEIAKKYRWMDHAELLEKDPEYKKLRDEYVEITRDIADYIYKK